MLVFASLAPFSLFFAPVGPFFIIIIRHAAHATPVDHNQSKNGLQAHRSLVKRLNRANTSRRYRLRERSIASGGRLGRGQQSGFVELDEEMIELEVTSDEEDEDALGEGYNAVYTHKAPR